MSTPIEIECTHIAGELMRVRFANTQIISDHPAQWGGTDSGPAPGAMVIMALAAASALKGRSHAALNGLDLANVGARASITMIQEGLEDDLRHVPLSYLTYVDRFWRLLEIDGTLDDEQRDALVDAMTANRIARTIQEGMDIEEKVVFKQPEPGSRYPSGESPGNHQPEKRPSLPAGESRVAEAKDWMVSASALDQKTCLVKVADAMHVVGDDIASQRGATPEEWLLGGLASCTTIFIARNAKFLDLPVQSVCVRVRAELADDPDQPISRVEKIAEVTGDFTPDEAAKVKDLAEFCAFGVTLRRSTPIVDSLSLSTATGPGTAFTPMAMLERPAAAPNDPAYCTDGSCCIPTFEKAN